MDETRGKKLEDMLYLYSQMAMNSISGPAGAWRTTSKHKFPLNSSTLLNNTGLTLPLQQPANKKLVNGELPFDFGLQLPFPVSSSSATSSLPLFLQPDTSHESGELIYYQLEETLIAGFNIGGEERLCLPPILNTTLKDIEIQVIKDAVDELQIQCPNCSDHQLRLLKQKNVLPSYVWSAGLIRKTDAERLCTRLLHPNLSPITSIDNRAYPEISGTCLPVYHECFGEAHGFLYPELYTSTSAKCISCADCEKLFTTERFITHSHYNQENRICHWGFNRANWRNYLLLSDDVIDSQDLEVLQRTFDETVEKFRKTSHKRTIDDDDVATPTEESMIGVPTHVSMVTDHRLITSGSPAVKRRCNRPPMKAYEYVTAGREPKLENPDMVITDSDSHKYGKHYVPNICLKLNSTSCVSAESEDVAPLDLRSPTQRQRYESVCSTTSETAATVTAAAAIVDEKTEEEEEEEILDVGDSSTADDEEYFTRDAAPRSQSKESTPAESEHGMRSIAVYISKMEAMFIEAVELTNLSEEERKSKKDEYRKFVEQVENNVSTLAP